MEKIKKFPLNKIPKKDYFGEMYEYDIISAGYNIFINDIVMLFKETIPVVRISEVIDNIHNKEIRNKLIGKIQRDYPETKEFFSIYFRFYLEKFLEQNNLTIKNVIRTSKDSLILNKKCENLIINEYIKFREIGNYSQLILFSDGNNLKCEVYIPFKDSEQVKIKGALHYTEIWKGFFDFFRLVAFSSLLSTAQEKFVKIKFFLQMFERDSLRFIEENDKITINFEGLSFKVRFKDIPIEYISCIDVTEFKERFLIPFSNKILKGK